MAISKEVLDELLKDYKGPDDLTGPDGLLKQLTKALVERAMQAEMTEHLGYEKGDPVPKSTGNRRNGSSRKKLRSDQGPMDIEVPRIGTPSSSPPSFQSTSGSSADSTTKSCRCTPGG